MYIRANGTTTTNNNNKRMDSTLLLAQNIHTHTHTLSTHTLSTHTHTKRKKDHKTREKQKVHSHHKKGEWGPPRTRKIFLANVGHNKTRTTTNQRTNQPTNQQEQQQQHNTNTNKKLVCFFGRQNQTKRIGLAKVGHYSKSNQCYSNGTPQKGHCHIWLKIYLSQQQTTTKKNELNNKQQPLVVSDGKKHLLAAD